MKEIKFYKMEAAGNDFVVVDNRAKIVRDPKAFARSVCPVHIGVGADGVLLVEPSRKADFFMRIINADGTEAEACGNGYRCVALFGHQVLGLGKKMKFETLSGIIETEVVSGSRVRARMTEPTAYDPDLDIPLDGRSLHAAFINTGVPHVVIFTEGLAKVPVLELGRPVRYHQQFAPAGANVNFAEVTGPQSLAIRTYERGVEDETLACGTGAAATAIAGVLSGRLNSPVDVTTRSGEVLTVSFRRSGRKVTDVLTEGSAHIVFKGEVNGTDSR